MQTRGISGTSESADLFYDDLISTYVDAPDIVSRDWIFEEVGRRAALPACRIVIFLGEPGAGKTGIIATLAQRNPEWLRYFIRSNSVAPLSSGDAISVMLRVGHQLAHRQPELFDPQLLQIAVEQRVGTAGSVVGVKIDDLKVSPFYRTAIRVKQDVADVRDRVVGVEIATATVEPQLLTVETLSSLALLAPAAALARTHPERTIVVLVDALDEIGPAGGAASILEWLETGPELPPNVRFVLSSRADVRLRMLQGIREGSVELIDLERYAEQVAGDVRTFAIKLFEATNALAGRTPEDKDAAIESFCRAARGNFAYLAAYARSLRAAVASHEEDTLAELLSFSALPAGLHPLYAAFIRRMRRQIESLGRLEIASPRRGADTPVLPWPGVGQRFIGVLAVARAPLSLDQLVALGSVAVWRSAASEILDIFRPFLDESISGWQLFHPSLGEFLKSAHEPEFSDVAVDAHEWNTRIVRYYQRDSDWAGVDWKATDDYGLLHLVEHLAAIDNDSAALSNLVVKSLKFAIKDRFHSDLPFRRIVDRALARAESAADLRTRLLETVFLRLVRSGLSRAAKFDPPVYGLLARLGRIEEALARAQVLAPGLHKYRSLEAIVACTPRDLRDRLGPNDGVDHLVGVALEISTTGDMMFGSLGRERNETIEEAATALLAHDAARAQRLVRGTGNGPSDGFLAEAARWAHTDDALGLLATMNRGKVSAALAAASTTVDNERRRRLVAFALEHRSEESPAERLRALATMVVTFRELVTERLAELERELRALVTSCARKKDSGDEEWPLVEAAGILHERYPELGEKLLSRFNARKADSSSQWSMRQAAERWASWGRSRESRALLEKILAHSRSLNGYRPADEIARVAAVAAKIDVVWARQLAEEAVALVEPHIGVLDRFERDRLNFTLGQMAGAFRSWDRDRALRIARWMSGSWISGGPWNGTDGRNGTLALIGLDAAADDRKLSAALLEECLQADDAQVVLGHPNPQLIEGQLFRSADAANDSVASVLRTANFATYVANEVNYWIDGRRSQFFSRPADVLRSLEFCFFPRASWARAVVAAIASVAVYDVDAALALAAWPTDPCERLIALGELAAAFDAARDPRFEQVLRTMERAASSLPEYAAELDLSAFRHGPVLMYLNPSVRARFEAAIALPAGALTLARSLIEATGSWYVEVVHDADSFARTFCASPGLISTKESAASVQRMLDRISGADDLVGDLARFHYAAALARFDVDRARAEAARISSAYVRALAQLNLVVYDEQPASTSRARSLEILNSLGEDVSRIQAAELAAAAASIFDADEDRCELLRWGEAVAAEGNPREQARGLIALSRSAPVSQRASQLARVLTLAQMIGNQYLRADVLADSLAPALAAGDPNIVVGVIAALLGESWSVFVEGLRRAMPSLVDALGPEIVESLDSVLRRAQRVLGNRAAGEGDPQDLDGVRAVRAPDDPQSTILNEPPPGYLTLFLDDADLRGLRCVQASQFQGPAPDDEPFSRLRGLESGLVVWLAELNDPIWRLVDIRFVFETPSAAADYYRERFQHLAEGNRVVTDATSIGEECAVLAGTMTIPEAKVEIRQCMYLFRIGCVVVKLYAAQTALADHSLSPADVLPLAKRIADKIHAAYPGASSR
jgi:hypothetical protein